MTQPSSPIRTGRNADIAFAIVVLALYFALFTQVSQAEPFQILSLIVLGTFYILLGVYGYSYASQAGSMRYVFAYLGSQLLLGGAIVYFSRGIGLSALILLPLAGHCAILFIDWRVAIANFGILLTYSLAVFFYSGSLQVVWELLPVFVAGMVFVIVFIRMAVSEEQARVEVEGLASHLKDANQKLQEYAAQVESLTIIQERNRMAREIHDGLGHSLTTIHMELQAVEAIITKDTTKAVEMVRLARQQTQKALQEVRQSVSALREIGTEKPLDERLRELVAGCELAGIQATLTIIGSTANLSSDVSHTLFRSIQEGVNNICKHSNAKHALITLDCTGEEIVLLRIDDDGIGRAFPISEGYGLTGLQERIEQLNGSLKVQSDIGKGFHIMIQVPK